MFDGGLSAGKGTDMTSLRMMMRDLVAQAGWMRRSLRPLLLVAAIAVPGLAQAQTPLGTAVGVRPEAAGELGGTRVTLVAGNQLFEGQTIVTDANGEVQIVFADETRMVVGPNSTLVIQTYLLQNANTVSNLTVNALGGTFRFISGNSAPEAYHITTPTGTISVRGTALDFTVDWLTGFFYVIVFEGEVIICNLANVCVILGAKCEVGTVGIDLPPALISESRPRFQITRSQFLYVISQWRLLNDFQVDDPRDCLFAPNDGAPPAENAPGAPEAPGNSGFDICDILWTSPFNQKSGLPVPGYLYDICYAK